MARREKRHKGGGGGRRLKRSRRGTVTHSAIATIFGLGVAMAPLANTPGVSGAQSALMYAQTGNWAGAFWAASYMIQQNWAMYLFALIPVILIAYIAKKFSGKLRLGKHWTV